MRSYDHKQIEKKWQALWERDALYVTENRVEGKENRYVLVEFPYPSGNLHIGHWYAFAVPDIYARYLRMKGKNVLFPIGFDSFGLPAENAAIKHNLDPRKWTYGNIETMTNQLKCMGNSFDWSRKIVASDPEYYRWTQWLFLELLRAGFAYKKKSSVPWCDSCKTVLANEQLANGACERCGTEVVQRELEQWFFKITDYAERLLADLDTLEWPEEIKKAQREWIGKSEGAFLKFAVKGNTVHDAVIDVFTTRPDTLYGVTYVVLAPEHSLVQQLKDSIENWGEVSSYIGQTAAKKELERKEAKEKTGVELKGVKAVNPANGEEVPVWIADYVLASYGTGAVMAVPAHDERDWDFAHTFDLPIRQVIAPFFTDSSGVDAVREDKKTERRKTAFVLLKHWSEDKYLCLDWGSYGWRSGIIGGIEESESPIDAGYREIVEETGYEHPEFVEYVGGEMHTNFFAAHKDVNRYAEGYGMLFKLADGTCHLPKEEETRNHSMVWIDSSEMARFLNLKNFQYMWDVLSGKHSPCFTGSGVAIHSGDFSGMTSPEAAEAITNHVNGIVSRQYRLRDWLLSRQRYWGCPIPVVYDPEGKPHPVPEEHLPWVLPEDVDFTPTGEAPLARSRELKERTEHIFGKGWTPEVDTMDTFVDSSWYFLRYLDPHNGKVFCSREAQEAWMPVAEYSGGAEHVTMHLLYSRFFYKALFDLGLVSDKEPYVHRMNRGLILGPDGRKMSKSRGNVIDPGEHVVRVGADVVKMYLAFIGPYNEVGQYPWDLGGIAGLRRFLERVWHMRERVVPDTALPPEGVLTLHQSIRKVGECIEAFKFNTAISQMMIVVNFLEKLKSVPVSAYEILVHLLAPFAPHLAEELWESLGHSTSVHREQWPEYDREILASAQVTIAVQINGKVRGTFLAEQGLSAPALLACAREESLVKECLVGVRVVREVGVRDRLVNFVIEKKLDAK